MYLSIYLSLFEYSNPLEHTGSNFQGAVFKLLDRTMHNQISYL